MANSLNREIEKGEIVVLKKEIFKPEYQDLENRLFEAQAGFGMSSVTSGTALFGKFISDGEECRFEGYDIDPKETEEYQKTHKS